MGVRVLEPGVLNPFANRVGFKITKTVYKLTILTGAMPSGDLVMNYRKLKPLDK